MVLYCANGISDILDCFVFLFDVSKLNNCPNQSTIKLDKVKVETIMSYWKQNNTLFSRLNDKRWYSSCISWHFQFLTTFTFGKSSQLLLHLVHVNDILEHKFILRNVIALTMKDQNIGSSTQKN